MDSAVSYVRILTFSNLELIIMESLLGFFGVMGAQFLLVLFYIGILLLLKQLVVSIFMRKPVK